jgi:integrase
MGQKVLAMKKAPDVAPKKIVAANQKAIDELELNSGAWKIAGVPGLSIRCWRHSKSYLLTRRIRGKLVQRVIGEMTLKQARAEANAKWSALKPAPAGAKKTFGDAYTEFMEQRELAVKTRAVYQYVFEKYCGELKTRGLADVGADRAGCRLLYHEVAKKHGVATANQVARLVSAVYRHARKVDMDLPETPTVAIDLKTLAARDWAFTDDELREWWTNAGKLTAIKRAWWQVALYTGARSGSVSALRWEDVNLETKVIVFRVTKRNKPYAVPIADRLVELLTAYHSSDEVPPSAAGWVFPSNLIPDGHLLHVTDSKRGVASPHHLRHSYRTTLAEFGASTDQARALLGHSTGGDVSRNYISLGLLVEPLRPLVNAVAERYAAILGM